MMWMAFGSIPRRPKMKLAGHGLPAYPEITFLVRLVRTMPMGIRKANLGREPLSATV
jgi:hypothetical protein